MDQEQLDELVRELLAVVRKEIEPLTQRLDTFAARVEKAEKGLNETATAAAGAVHTVGLKLDASAFAEMAGSLSKSLDDLPEMIKAQAAELVDIRAPEILKSAEDILSELVDAMVDRAIEKALASIELPAPVPGKDAPAMEITSDETGVTLSFSDGRAVTIKHGTPGADGVGIAAIEEHDEHTRVTMTDGKSFTVLDGKPGADALGFKSVETVGDGVVFELTDGTAHTISNGLPGKDGVGIKTVAQLDEGVVLSLTNGETVEIAHGAKGLDGVGIAGIEATDIGALIKLTNGESMTVFHGKDGLNGIGIKGFDEGSDGVLVMLDDERTFRLKHGIDGEPGVDGVGLDDFRPVPGGHELAFTDGRTIRVNHGEDGKDGVGIKDVVRNAEGHVALVLTNDETKGLGKLKGEDGADGVGLADAFIDRTGGLVLVNSKGVAKELGPVVGQDGVTPVVDLEALKGKDGLDGIGFDEMAVAYDGERTLEITFTRGDEVKSYPLTLPIMISKGFWKAGAYAAGDVVSWAGASWVCKADTEDKPDPSPNWEILARKGRDGLSIKGDKGEPGKAGKPGRDLTQLGSDGSKW